MRAIAASPTSLAPVLDAVTRSAMRLCPANDIAVWRLEGDELERVASALGDRTPIALGTRVPLSRLSVTGRAIVDRQTIHVHDIQSSIDDEFPDSRFARIVAPSSGGRSWRSPCVTRILPLADSWCLVARSLHSRQARFGCSKRSPTRRPSPSQTPVCSRSFRSAPLSSRGQSASWRRSGEVSQAVSSSLDLQEVLTMIVSHAGRLSGADAGTVYELDE